MIDRNNLSELYSDISGRTDNMNLQHTNTVKPKIDIINFMFCLPIALQLTVIVGFLIVLVNYFTQITNASNIAIVLPSIVLLLLAWVGISAASLINISNRLSGAAVSNGIFLLLYAISAAPLAQMMFNIYRHNEGSVSILPFISMLLIENIIVIRILLLIIDSKKMSDTTKKAFFIALVVFCVLVTIINSIL